MKLDRTLLLITAALLALSCSSTKVSDRDAYAGGKIPRPARILVYDFAVAPSDLPSWSGAAGGYPDAAAILEPDDLEAGRKLGADLARELVARIDAMGMTAVRAEAQPGPQLDDIAITGFFTSVEAGSGAERVVLGFGKGAPDVQVHAVGYRKTAAGMERLGGGTLEDGGAGKSPGLVVPALVTVATRNPIGLAVSSAVKAEGEISGRTTEVGSAERIADEIAGALESQFRKQGWIDSDS